MTNLNIPLVLADQDTTPRLSRLKRPSSLDETIETCIGDFGWKQFFQAFLVSFACFFDAQQIFISVFADAQPTWHCDSIPCTPTANLCQLPRGAWAWDFPDYVSIISEWSLECSSSIIVGLPASSFFMGCLVGGFALASLADSSIGRKNMLVLSCLVMSITSALTAISTNLWMYSALRFLSGFGRATIGTCSLVLSTELVGKKRRGQVGIMGFFFFSFGFQSLPGLAYLNRGSSWRLLYLWTSFPAIAYCVLVHYFVCESPRWLYVRGRKEQFVETLRSIAPSATRSSLTLSFFGSFIECEHKDESQSSDFYSAFKILWENTWAFRRLLAMMIAGFGIGMVYYGMPLGLGNLAYNIYLSVTLNALSEVPACLVTLFLIEKLNRRSLLFGFALLSGICSTMCVVNFGSINKYWKEIQLVFELVSFFSACTAFDVFLIYALELFPTCVRNSAVSMARQAVVFGGVFSPLLVAAGRNNAFMSYGVFGLTISIGGLFVGCLPETRDGTLCDTMDEEEHKGVVNTALLNDDQPHEDDDYEFSGNLSV